MNYEHYNILIRKSQPPKLIYFVDNPVNNKRDTSGDWEVTPGLRELTQLPPSRGSWVKWLFSGSFGVSNLYLGRVPRLPEARWKKKWRISADHHRDLSRGRPGRLTSSPHLVGQSEILYHIGEFRSLKPLTTPGEAGSREPAHYILRLGPRNNTI